MNLRVESDDCPLQGLFNFPLDYLATMMLRTFDVNFMYMNRLKYTRWVGGKKSSQRRADEDMLLTVNVLYNF